MEAMQYWETYLNDHRAGATAGTALVRRIWRSNCRTKWGPIIEKVAESIEQDLVVLDKVRAAAGVSGGDLKRAAALLTERASRLKLNGHLLTYSPLSRVVELETLLSAVRGKQSLWVTCTQQRRLIPNGPSSTLSPSRNVEASNFETLRRVHEWAVTEMMGAGP